MNDPPRELCVIPDVYLKPGIKFSGTESETLKSKLCTQLVMSPGRQQDEGTEDGRLDFGVR